MRYKNTLTSVFVLCAGFLLAAGAMWGADWLTDGGDQQRTGWQRDEKILTKENARNIKMLWKIQLETSRAKCTRSSRR